MKTKIQQLLILKLGQLYEFLRPYLGRLERARQELVRPSIQVIEPLVYQKDSKTSYFQDLARSITQTETSESRQRLRAHADQVTYRPEYAESRRPLFGSTGGYTTPPLWMQELIPGYASAIHPYVDLLDNQSLPAGTDSINVPHSEKDTDDPLFISAPVRTLAGQQGIAYQLLDQSPISFDDVILRDLVSDFAYKTALQVIAGSGSQGQVLGVRNTPGIHQVAAADGSAAALHEAIGASVTHIHSNRHLPPQVILMHPDRWDVFRKDRTLWEDTRREDHLINGRHEERVVAVVHDLPVVLDPNLPTKTGPEERFEAVHVLRASDITRWHSPLRARAIQSHRDVTGVELQLYGYMAFTAARHPSAVSEILVPRF